MGGGVKNVKKMTSPFFALKIMNLLVGFDFEPKKCFQVPSPQGLYGAEWDERFCNLCSSQLFLLCWQFWALWSPVLPTLRGVSADYY